MSIITPSFNMLGYLERCCASVRDQANASFEHIVVDGGSSDGSGDWLKMQPGITAIIGKDAGMYDAINKGLRICSGDIVSYLSCDEQYVPGTLAFVKEYFESHPEVDGVFGDTLVVRPDGSLICFRKAYRPLWPFIAAGKLYDFPSSMFLRRTIIDRGDLFDASFKDIGDAEFVVRLLRKGYQLTTTRRYLSAFTITGSNRGQQPSAREEGRRFEQMVPLWIVRWRLPLQLAQWLVKLASGAYFERPPLSYSIYGPRDEGQRTTFVARAPSPLWRIA